MVVFQNKGAMAATIVVAASDSLNKAAANYVCDGVADNVEIQAAIDALPAGGGEVVLLEGTYNCISTIDGSNRAGLTLRGIGLPQLDFSGAPAGTHSLDFRVLGSTDNLLVTGLYVKNSKDVAIICGGTNIRIEKNTIKDALTQGINVQGTDISIKNNEIIGITDEFGIVLGGYVLNAIITHNQLRDAYIGIQWGYSGEGVIISHNEIYDSAQGIVIGGIETGAIFYTRRAKIANNIINTMGSSGIIVDKKVTADPTHVVEDIIIEGNQIYSVGGYGIYVGSTVETDTVIVRNNYVDGATYGLVGNPIEVSGNTFLNLTTHGIGLVTIDGITIRNNRIDTVTNDCINFPAGNVLASVNIWENILANPGRDAIRNMNSKNVSNVKRNLGYVTENSGLAALPMDGAITSKVWPHGLAATPSNVIVTALEVGGISAFVNAIGATNFTVNIPAGIALSAIAVTGAVAVDGGVTTDETVPANNAAVNDMTLLPAVPVADDAYDFVGSQMYGGVRVNIGTQGVGVWTIVWEYYNTAGAWVALAGVVDGTTGFTAAAGSRDVTFTIPTNWANTAVYGKTGYHVRARVSAYTSIVTQPLGTQAWLLDALHFMWRAVVGAGA